MLCANCLCPRVAPVLGSRQCGDVSMPSDVHTDVNDALRPSDATQVRFTIPSRNATWNVPRSHDQSLRDPLHEEVPSAPPLHNSQEAWALVSVPSGSHRPRGMSSLWLDSIRPPLGWSGEARRTTAKAVFACQRVSLLSGSCCVHPGGSPLFGHATVVESWV